MRHVHIFLKLARIHIIFPTNTSCRCKKQRSRHYILLWRGTIRFCLLSQIHFHDVSYIFPWFLVSQTWRFIQTLIQNDTYLTDWSSESVEKKTWIYLNIHTIVVHIMLSNALDVKKGYSVKQQIQNQSPMELFKYKHQLYLLIIWTL